MLAIMVGYLLSMIALSTRFIKGEIYFQGVQKIVLASQRANLGHWTESGRIISGRAKWISVWSIMRR
jgi:hypothetical protein